MKPLLFLDVDGVLNACPPINGEEVMTIHGFPICIPPGTKERIRRLLEVFEPVWATAWRGDAHPSFREHLGLSEVPWPHIDYRDWKLRAILDYDLRGRRWVWIDDDAGWELRETKLETPNGLVLIPKLAVGITDEHVEQAIAFVHEDE